jgi:hypothetical protein
LSVIALTAGSVAFVSMMMDSLTGVLASVAFASTAIVAASLFPASRWRAVALCGIAVLAVTVSLCIMSANEIVIDNESGQGISQIWIMSTAHSFRVDGLPNGVSCPVTIRDLFFDGHMNVGGGSLQDGSRLEIASSIKGDRYRRHTRIVIERGGRVRIIWE